MREYTVTIGGIDHSVLLDEADAKRMAAKAVKPLNKAVDPEDKADGPPHPRRK